VRVFAIIHQGDSVVLRITAGDALALAADSGDILRASVAPAISVELLQQSDGDAILGHGPSLGLRDLRRVALQVRHDLRAHLVGRYVPVDPELRRQITRVVGGRVRNCSSKMPLLDRLTILDGAAARPAERLNGLDADFNAAIAHRDRLAATACTRHVRGGLTRHSTTPPGGEQVTTHALTEGVHRPAPAAIGDSDWWGRDDPESLES
jgi:hypothetical protein